jgi:hypothetical protein
MSVCGVCRKRRQVFRLGFSPCAFCEDCFSKNLERKILRNLRRSGLLKKGRIEASLGTTLEQAVVFYVLKKHLGRSPKFAESKKSSYLAEPVESFSSRFISGFIEGAILKPSSKNLLWLCSAEEIKKYAELKKIPGKISNYGKIFHILSETKKKDPAIFFSIARSAEKINESIGSGREKKGKEKKSCS